MWPLLLLFIMLFIITNGCEPTTIHVVQLHNDVDGTSAGVVQLHNGVDNTSVRYRYRCHVQTFDLRVRQPNLTQHSTKTN